MALPLALLAGLVVVLANCELAPTDPGAGSLATLLPALALLALPALLALWSLRAVRADLVRGRAGAVPPRALLRLSALATPLVVHALFALAAYGDWIERLAWDSHLGRIVLAVLPVFVAELPRLVVATVAQVSCELAAEVRGTGLAPGMLPRLHELGPVVRLRFGWPLLLVMPLLLLGTGMDLMQAHRGLYVFTLLTSPGMALGSVVFLLAAVAALPWWFRFAFAVRELPEPPRARMQQIAGALGFPPQRVLLLPTGMRALNAMLVGPLPFGRCLCLTDGLVRELDVESLSGVVAHEVGHARMGHPSLLIAMVMVLPLALLAPLRFVDAAELDITLRAAAVVAAFSLLWLLVRALAHRFEHEADAVSVQALGAGPCTRALLVVSRLALPVAHGPVGRWFTLHPDEPRRWQAMHRYENDAGFRAGFDRAGRRLRFALGLLLLAAAAIGTSAWRQDWPFERIAWRLHAGDHRAALALAGEVVTVPARWERSWRALQQELAVAAAMGPAAADWDAARAALEPAWARGEQVLLAQGPAAARPWFSLALGAIVRPTALQRAVHAYCDAAADEQPERMAALAAIVRGLGVPQRLHPVFAADGRPQ